jgi:putative Holliday junction resolvase
MPVSSGGAETAAAKRIRKLGDKLAQERGLEVAYQDERLTSWEARETLRELGYKPAQIDAMEDQEAARLMLQAYLDRLKMPDRHPTGDKKPLWRD